MVETRVRKVPSSVWTSIPSRADQLPETTFQAFLSRVLKVSEKAGRLGEKLGTLRAERQNALQKRADELLAQQIKKIGFEIGTPGRSSYSSRGRVSVRMKNNTDYAFGSAKYSNHPQLAGYFKGIKITDYSDIRIPDYDTGQKTVLDSMGFDKGYAVAPGGKVRIGTSIYASVEGLNMNSPSGRLLAKERGWSPDGSGYIYPDEIRIVNFPASLFLIPDEKGTRVGASIVYKPTVVNFRRQAEAKGLPQDSEIARLSEQMKNQSFPEDAQIASLENEISDLRSQQQSERESFNTSPIATRISSLTESESVCRSSRDGMTALNNEIESVREAQGNLSSCGTENLDPAAVYSAISFLNNRHYAGINQPNISEKYRAKAEELIWSKLADSSQSTTRTTIDGAFDIDGSVDQDNSLAFATWTNNFGEAFWMQPLSSLGPNKDLSYQTARDGSFEDYLERVISVTSGNMTLDAISKAMVRLELDAPDPNQLNDFFNARKEFAAHIVSEAEASQLSQDVLVELELEARDSTALTCET